MRLPRFRFNVRWMMVAVGVASCLVWGTRMRLLAGRYGSLAAGYALEEGRSSAALRREIEKGALNEDPTMYRDLGSIRLRKELKAEVDYLTRMRAKYRRAARYPWLAVLPDPPDPRQTTNWGRDFWGNFTGTGANGLLDASKAK